MKKKEAILANISTRQVLSSYWQVIGKYWLLMGAMIFLSISGNILGLITPLYYKKFFDVVTVAPDPSLVVGELLHIITAILVLAFAGWAAFRTMNFINNYYQAYVMAELKQQALEYMMDHSYRFFSNNFTGSLTQRISRYSRSFERLGDQLIFNMIPLATKIIGVIVVLLFVSPPIAGILLGLIVFFVTFNYFFSQWKLKYNIERAAMDSYATGVLSDMITNHTTIQLFTGAETEKQHYRDVTYEQGRITKFTWNLDSLTDGLQSGIMVFAEFLLFYYALKYWAAGALTVGTFVLIQIYFLNVWGQLWGFSRIIRDIYESMADAKEMVEILVTPHEVRDVPTASTLVVSTGDIQFADVDFAFNQTRMVLKKFNLHIYGGEKVALVGPSGAGKSTIVRLLLRMYDVSGGAIEIDGQDIQHVTQDSVRSQISLVPQDPILFHRTLMENIRYGRRNASDEEVMEAARLAHCHEFIEDLPKKYETFVGERGIKLSGGERQRVAIARAILRNAPILILDEATSSLDSHSEALIQDALAKLMKGKTTIAIAHRLSTIKEMDRILVIKGGRVIEDGPHETLITKKESLYGSLWNLQAGGFLKDDAEVV